MIRKMLIAFAAIAMVLAASTTNPSIAAVRSASGPSKATASRIRPPAHGRQRTAARAFAASSQVSKASRASEAFHTYHAIHCEQEKRKLRDEISHLHYLLEHRQALLQKHRGEKRPGST
jgi:hypothetical protein